MIAYFIRLILFCCAFSFVVGGSFRQSLVHQLRAVEDFSAPGDAAWLKQLGACLAATFFVGINDVVWFLPFAASRRGWRFVLPYLAYKEAVAAAASAVTGAAAWLAQRHPELPVQRALSYATAVLLLFYSFVLFQEWRAEGSDNDAVESACPKKPPRREPSHWQLCVISVIGNLDNLGVFIPSLSDGFFTCPQLLLCVLLCGLVVVAVCMGASQLQPVVAVVDSLPLWAVIAAFALWSFSDAALGK